MPEIFHKLERKACSGDLNLDASLISVTCFKRLLRFLFVPVVFRLGPRVELTQRCVEAIDSRVSCVALVANLSETFRDPDDALEK